MRDSIERIRRIFDRGDARSAAINFAWLIADKLVRFLLGACVGFAVARHLGPDAFGLMGYVAAVVGVIAMMVEGGQEGVVRRDLLTEPEGAPRLLATALAWRILVGAAAYASIAGAAWLGGIRPEERGLWLALGLMVFQPVAMLFDLWFQARLESRRAVTMQWVALAMGAAMRVWLIAVGAGVVALAWVSVLELLVAGVLLAVRARSSGLRVIWTHGLADRMRRLWREAWPLLASGLAVAVYMRIDTVMLRHISGEKAAGVYIAGARFAEIWFFLPGALAASFLPTLTKAKAAQDGGYERKLRQYCEISAALGYALAVPTMLAAHFLIRLAYGPAYAESAGVLMVLVWILPLAAIGVARGQVCVLEGWTRFHLAATVVAAFVNVVLNYFLIPRHGPVGAAFATVVAQVTSVWLSTFFYAPARSFAWMQTRALLAPHLILRHER